MYGLPPGRELTYDEYVTLVVCMPRACARLAKIQVSAAQIAAGGLGGEDYHALDTFSPAEAQREYETALLQWALRRNR